MKTSKNLFNYLALLLVAIFFTACGGVSSNTSSNDSSIDDGVLVALEVSSSSTTTHVGVQLQLTALGIYSNGAVKNLTNTVNWNSSSPSTSTINNQGLASPLAAGTTTITANYSGKAGSAPLTVSSSALQSVVVTPSTLSYPVGVAIPYSAVGIFADGYQDLTTNVTWSSSSSIASISGNLVTGNTAGTTTISAQFNSISGSGSLTLLNVTLQAITVLPTNSTTHIGSNLQFTALGTYSNNRSYDISNSATWKAATAGIVNINNSGLATPFGAGTTLVTASLNGISGNTQLTVLGSTLVSLMVSAANSTVYVGSSPISVTAIGVYSDGTSENITNSVIWSSSNTQAAIVSNTIGSQGIVSIVGPGNTLISAIYYNTASSSLSASTTVSSTMNSIISGSLSLTVSQATLKSIIISPATTTAYLGAGNLQYSATATYSNGNTSDVTTSVTWQSSNNSLATVDNLGANSGLVTPIAAGTVSISATLNGITASASLVISAAPLQAIIISPNPAIAYLGAGNINFQATGIYQGGGSQNITSSVAWMSSDQSIATIANGIAIPLTSGTTTITASSGTINSSTTLTVKNATLLAVNLTPQNPVGTIGQTLQFTATGSYSDGGTANVSANANWTSSVNSVATISNTVNNGGLALIANPGTTVVQATFSGLSDSTTLIAVFAPAITVSTTGLDGNGGVVAGESFIVTATLSGGYQVPNQTITLTAPVPAESNITYINNGCSISSASPVCSITVNVGTAAVLQGYSVAVTNSGSLGSGIITPAIIDFTVLPPVWLPLGYGPVINNGISASNAFNSVQAAATTDGSIYVSYGYLNGYFDGSGLKIQKYDGTAWTALPDFQFESYVDSGGTPAYDYSLAAGPQNILYVALQGFAHELNVYSYDGGDAWFQYPTIYTAEVGNPVYGVELALDSSGTPYVYYTVGAFFPERQIASVIRYNSSSLTWESVGVPFITPGEPDNFSANLVIKNDIPYIVYSTGTIPNSGVVPPLTVEKFDGTNWVPLGNPIPRADDNCSLAVDNNNVPYIVMDDGSGNVIVSSYNSGNNSWESVGTVPQTVNSDFIIFNKCMIAFSPQNDLYLSCPFVPDPTDSLLENYISVMKFDGQNWNIVGNSPFSLPGLYNTSNWLIIPQDGPYAGIPYVAYNNVSGGSNSYTGLSMEYYPY